MQDIRFFFQKASLVSSDIFGKFFKSHIMEIVDQEKVIFIVISRRIGPNCNAV